MKPARTLALAASLAALAGCASAPIAFHSLLPSVQAAAGRQTQPVTMPIDFRPTEVPAYLDRPELVVKRPDGTLILLGNDRWSNGFREEVDAALRDTLSRALGGADVAALGKSAGPPVLSVQLTLRRLEASASQSVYLEADWSLGGTATGTGLRCRSAMQKPVSAAIADIVATQRSLLQSLFAQMARAAQNGKAHGTAACSAVPPDG